MWVTLVRLPSLIVHVFSGDVGVLGAGDDFDLVGPEERERRHTRLCDLRERNMLTALPSLKQSGAPTKENLPISCYCFDEFV